MKWFWLGGAILFLIQAYVHVDDGGWIFWLSLVNVLLYITNFVIRCSLDERRERVND